MNMKVVHLDGRAVEHIKSELSAANQLGRLVLSSTQLEQGSVMTVVPESGNADPYAFRNSVFPRDVGRRVPVPGGFVEPVPSTDEHLSAWVHRILRLNPRSAVVCESYLLRARDLAKAAGLPRRTFACGEFVYHWAAHDDLKQDVAAVVRLAYQRPLGFGVICTLSGDPVVRFDAVAVDLAVLTAAAQSVDCIILGAYDGESVVVWARNGALAEPLQI